MTSKYDPLGDFLAAQKASEVPMSFLEIEKVIGAPLPPKAVNYPAWWSNNTSNNTMTKVWLEAGYRTERVDVRSRRLVFRRSRSVARGAAENAILPVDAPRASSVVARMRAALAGTVRVAPGVDLAAPTGEVWRAENL
jgi:hypothetical protein